MNDPTVSPRPAPSATVLLLRQRDSMEVLMVKRGAGGAFASAHVFPGGKLDEDDMDDAWLELATGADSLNRFERGLRIAGWREIYEETNLLPGPCLAGLSSQDRDCSFIELIRRSGAQLPLAEMQPFARWITPHFAPKRFDTHFYLCALDADDAICDGFETVASEWIAPEVAMAKDTSGECKLLFPTKSQLRRLIASGSIEQAIADAAAQPIIPIEPRRVARENGVFVVIPENAGYAECEERIEAV